MNRFGKCLFACALAYACSYPSSVAFALTGQMTVPGGGGVDGAGQFQCSIPISAPPGTAGIAPALSLGYSSRGGDGALGYGWALNGLDAITRCPATIAVDGARGSVNYSNTTDKFCLDGQRLMKTTGIYDADGSTSWGRRPRASGTSTRSSTRRATISPSPTTATRRTA